MSSEKFVLVRIINGDFTSRFFSINLHFINRQNMKVIARSLEKLRKRLTVGL